jgi:hypothetical protein
MVLNAAALAGSGSRCLRATTVPRARVTRSFLSERHLDRENDGTQKRETTSENFGVALGEWQHVARACQATFEGQFLLTGSSEFEHRWRDVDARDSAGRPGRERACDNAWPARHIQHGVVSR